MAMKQLTLASFQFKNLENDQDKSSPSTSGENTDICLASIPEVHGPSKNTGMFYFNETTD